MSGGRPAALVGYGCAFPDRAAKELDPLPPESAIVEMLKGHHVMRQQARACRRGPGTD